MNTDLNKRPNRNSGNMQICPSCGSADVRSEEREHRFPYGCDGAEVELKAIVPVRVCPNCGLSFMDRAGEEACHDAICRYLGVLTPSQIRALRRMCHLNQAKFGEVTGLGQATVSRWERGIVVQNKAYDNYVFLLGFDENLRRIRERRHRASGDQSQSSSKPVFRNLSMTRTLWARQKAFHLRACLAAES
jgi:putative zinc finger/helix-turn-helix YgiT family protein